MPKAVEVLKITEAPRGRRPGTAGVFPFGFRRQGVFDSFLLTQPLAELDTVVPAQVQYRLVVLLLELDPHHGLAPRTDGTPPLVRLVAVESLFGFGLITRLVTELTILSNSNFRRAHVKRLCDPNAVSGHHEHFPHRQTFRIEPGLLPGFQDLVVLLQRPAHVELTRRDQRQLHADRVRVDQVLPNVLSPLLLKLSSLIPIKRRTGHRRMIGSTAGNRRQQHDQARQKWVIHGFLRAFPATSSTSSKACLIPG